MIPVVYKVGPHEGPELRYSLRSLQNIDHGQVWILGRKPDWIANVRVVETTTKATKYKRLWMDLAIFVNHPDTPDRFAMFDDDFFAVRPTTIPTWWQPDLKPDKVVKNAWRRSGHGAGRTATYELLREWQVAPIRNYDLHVPMVVEKRKMAEVLELAGTQIKALQPRSLYANYYQVGGRRHRDVKIGNLEDVWHPNQSWVSTGDTSFEEGAVGQKLRDLFPDPSVFEEA